MASEEAHGASPEGRRYTAEEVRAALAALSDDDIRRLKLVARHFAPRSGMSEDDLLQEAFVRVLGSRTCKADVGILRFVAGTIKSIASEGPRARKKAREGHGFEVTYVPEYGVADVPDPVSNEVSPADAAFASLILSKEVQRVAEMLQGDDELQLLAEGLIERYRGKALEDLLGTDTKGLAAARARLLRKLKKTFPEGIPV